MIILAPHPDDELIGCWPYLKTGQVSAVVYFFDYNEPALTGRTRRDEAITCAEYFGFLPIFAASLELPAICAQDICAIPSITDSHPQHRLVHNLGRLLPRKLFYCVDLEYAQGKTLEPNPCSKREALDVCYPSQASLWRNNHSYFLFNKTYEEGSCLLHTAQVNVKGEEYVLTADIELFAYDLPALLGGSGGTPANVLIDFALYSGATFVEVKCGNKLWRPA